jgi:hypothetical protein
MEMLGITAVAAITVICYLAAALAKALGMPGKWLPVLCGLCGGALGMAAMYLMAEYPADDLITAAAVGIVSGFAATGVDQAIKQLTEKSE